MALLEDKTLRAGFKSPHSVVLENREKANISGVDDVESFDEQNMMIHTQLGTVSIKGSGLHINKYNVESGDLLIEGLVDEVLYLDDEGGGKRGGLFSRLFG